MASEQDPGSKNSSERFRGPIEALPPITPDQPLSAAEALRVRHAIKQHRPGLDQAVQSQLQATLEQLQIDLEEFRNSRDNTYRLSYETLEAVAARISIAVQGITAYSIGARLEAVEDLRRHFSIDSLESLDTGETAGSEEFPPATDQSQPPIDGYDGA